VSVLDTHEGYENARCLMNVAEVDSVPDYVAADTSSEYDECDLDEDEDDERNAGEPAESWSDDDNEHAKSLQGTIVLQHDRVTWPVRAACSWTTVLTHPFSAPRTL